VGASEGERYAERQKAFSRLEKQSPSDAAGALGTRDVQN